MWGPPIEWGSSSWGDAAVPVATQCTHCQAKYRVADGAVGKRATCAKCGQRFTVAVTAPADDGRASSSSTSPASDTPSAKPPTSRADASRAAAAAAPAPTKASAAPAAKQHTRLTEREFREAITGALPRKGPSIAYRLGIVLVALAMIVLPLVYLAIIALVGFGVYYHAQYHMGLLEMGHGRSWLLFASVYVAPLIAGPIAVFFMFKPLLARPVRHERFRSVTRQNEPLLFAFVDQVCDVVGAPKPKRIDVDCEVNASAQFRRGMMSMLGNDLVLTIGLPLVAGMTLREFGGVLAHEFGHFAQGAGMRLTYLVRGIVHWFVRVVYQRDQWDEWLDGAAQELDLRIGWIFVVAHLFVLVGRGVLWVLLHIGLAIAGVMLRQMEYDADRYEAQFAGSEGFVRTMRKLHLLSFAEQFAHAQLSVSLQQQQLVDNLPGLIAHYAQHASPEVWQQADRHIAESKTGWLDSHPCSRDRATAAERLASPGIFHLDKPSAALFADFRAQTEAATWGLYCAVFGPGVPRSALLPLDQFVAVSSAAGLPTPGR